MPLIDYSEFNKKFFPQVYSERIPLVGGMECTFRCNLHCVHCYVPRKKKNLRELSLKQTCHILDQVADEGCLWFLLTGGEPLVQPDFLEIYKYAKKKGLIVTIFTNGTLITQRIAGFLRDLPPFLVEITMYGATKETYERVTRVEGSFERYRQGIDLLLKNGIQLQLKALILKINKHELWDMKAQATSFGVDFRFDGVINPQLDGNLNPCAERISPEEMVELDIQDRARFDEWQRFAKKYAKRYNSKDSKERKNYFYHCGAGINCFHIAPDGQLCPCLLARHPSYDLLKGTFHRGWHEFMRQVRFQEAPEDYQCGNCDLLSLCGYCPGWYQLERVKTEEPRHYLCQIAHLRAKAFLGEKYFKKKEVAKWLLAKPTSRQRSKRSSWR